MLPLFALMLPFSFCIYITTFLYVLLALFVCVITTFITMFRDINRKADDKLSLCLTPLRQSSFFTLANPRKVQCARNPADQGMCVVYFIRSYLTSLHKDRNPRFTCKISFFNVKDCLGLLFLFVLFSEKQCMI